MKAMKTKPQFVHLHTHSDDSLLDGLSKIPALVQRAKDLGMNAVAVTDHGNMYGAIELYKEAKKQGIKPIIGMEGYVTSHTMQDKNPSINEKRWHIILLAKDNTGYKNLIKLSTLSHLEGFYYKPRLDKETLAKYAEGIIALSGCLGGELGSAILEGRMRDTKKIIEEHKAIFGKENYYLEVQHNINDPEQKKVNEAIFALSKETDTPMVATADSHYLSKDDQNAHDILLAIQTGNTIKEERRMKLTHLDLSIVSPEEMNQAFPDHPDAVSNAQKIADRCDVEIPLGDYQLPHYEVPKGYTAASYLRKQCVLGLHERYGLDTSSLTDYDKDIAPQSKEKNEILERLDYELNIIIRMGYEAYMLIVADFVIWAKDNKIVVGPGRGSAAGSLVSYLLNITNIDPIKYGLIFERFLNPDRISMPDIDLDFADTRRDEVLKYVSDKYGKENVAQIITFGTMAARAAIRDVGRALDYEYQYCDRISKMIPFMSSLDNALQNVEELKTIYATDEQAKTLIDNARRLEGVTRHASTHACGVVITKEPLTELIPLQHATKDTETIITQYEMHAIEDLGLLKMDFLGLKNLTIIENTLQEVHKTHGVEINIETVDHKDAKVYELLQKGDTTGVFQLESGGMRRYLKDLKPTEFEDIVVMISLYRPGPMELIPTYIRRKHGQEETTYDHPRLEPILKNTYGVGVYQEQMMQIARDLAGFTLAEADTLRKAIGKKIKELLDEQETKIISGMKKNGIDKKSAQKVWSLFPGFARYGFNRSHAVSYAEIAYQTAYLKAHYPTEFMMALLNAEAKHIDRLSFLLHEADMHSIKILPPSIQESGAHFTTIKEREVRFGLAAIKNVGSNVVDLIIQKREEEGGFSSLEHFLQCIGGRDFNKKSLEALIKAGAFDTFDHRNKLLYNVEALLQYAKQQSALRNSNQSSLFGETDSSNATHLTLKDIPECSEIERLDWEKELLGFFVSGHPLKQYQDKIQQCTSIQSLKQHQFPSARVAALVGSTKKIITKKGDPMLFFDIEDLSGKIEAIAFPQTFSRHQNILMEGKVLYLDGKIDTATGELKFLCNNAIELS